MEHLTVETFKDRIFDFEKNETKLRGTTPVIIDFYADWCGPCRMIAPILEELSVEYKGKVDIYKVNVDDEPALSKHFSIRNIPAVLFLPVDSVDFKLSVGAKSKPIFVNSIKDYFSV